MLATSSLEVEVPGICADVVSFQVFVGSLQLYPMYPYCEESRPQVAYCVLTQVDEQQSPPSNVYSGKLRNASQLPLPVCRAKLLFEDQNEILRSVRPI